MSLIKGTSKFVFVFSALVLSSCASRNLHREFKNPERRSEEVLRREWTYPIEPLSSALPIGGMEYVSPVIFENTLIFGSDRYGLISMYPKVERPRWKIPFENGVVSPLEISGDTGYFTAGDGNLYAIDLLTGKTIWTYAIRNPVTSQPTKADEDLYLVTSDDTLISLEAKTGKWQWHYKRRNLSAPAIHGASKPLVIGDVIWVGFADGALVSLSRKDGKVLTEKQLNTNKRFSSINAELTLQGDVVFVPAYDGALYALNAKTGNALWVKDHFGGSRKITVTEGALYAPSSDGNVYAIDEKTGHELWKFELDQGVPSDIVVTEKHILFASSSEYLYALERSSGKLVYRYHVGYGSGFSGGLAYDAKEKMLYAMSRGGNLMSFHYLVK